MSTSSPGPPPEFLSRRVGLNIWRAREKWGVTQEQIAIAAQEYGLEWTRWTVAELERARRALAAHELLALPIVLARAFAAHLPAAAAQLSAPGLLHDAAGGGTLQLSPDLVLTEEEVAGILGGAVPTRTPSRRIPADSEKRAAAKLGVSLERLDELSHEQWGREFVAERDRRVRLKREQRRAQLAALVERIERAQADVKRAQRSGSSPDAALEEWRLAYRDLTRLARTGPAIETAGPQAFKAAWKWAYESDQALRGHATRELLTELRQCLAP
jgi:hypothetical protein